MHDNGAEDWRIPMTMERVTLMALELVAVAIHPYPMGLLAYVQKVPPTAETELEIMLALPMFLRLYLLGRAMMLHSRLFTDTASRSIGALNKVRGRWSRYLSLSLSLFLSLSLPLACPSFWSPMFTGVPCMCRQDCMGGIG